MNVQQHTNFENSIQQGLSFNKRWWPEMERLSKHVWLPEIHLLLTLIACLFIIFLNFLLFGSLVSFVLPLKIHYLLSRIQKYHNSFEMRIFNPENNWYCWVPVTFVLRNICTAHFNSLLDLMVPMLKIKIIWSLFTIIVHWHPDFLPISESMHAWLHDDMLDLEKK